ncbi:MAG: phosphoglycolate phosphatase [Yersinia sp. (in: enterobacteria)]
MTKFGSIRGVAFDLDGTLVDSAPGLASAIDMALQHQGLPVAGKARVSTWIGNGADVLIERALRWAGREPHANAVARTRELFNSEYAKSIEQGSQLFPQVKATLTRLKASGLPMGLITNKPTPFIAPLLASLDIADYFSVIIGGDDVVVKKPHPAPLYLLLAKLGLRASEMLFVGDSRNDIMAAQAAGCPCIGLTYGYNYGETIATSHPDCVLEHFADLLPAIGLLSLKDQEV